MISLGQFCRDYNLSKTTVRRRAQELGFDTANGLDWQAQQALMDEFDIVDQAPSATVEMGNHSTALSLEVGADTTTLEQFRSDRIRQQLANPREFMQGLDGFLDQIEEGMDAAEQQQEAELTELRALKRKTQKRVTDFRRRADQYRIKSDLLTHMENNEVGELQELAAEVNALGKPSETGE